jgi:hypothetical protein
MNFCDKVFFPVEPAFDLPTSTRRTPGVLMSDCLHCDILEMLQSRHHGKEADLAEVTSRVTEVLADLILMAPPDDQTMLLADVLANLGGMLLQKSEEDADPSSPHRRH